MGHLSNEHIRLFVVGQTISELETDPNDPSCFRFRFTNGESLRVAPHKRGCECCKVEIIATPFDAQGEIKQSVATKQAIDLRGEHQ